MTAPLWMRSYRLIFAILTLAAVFVQLSIQLDKPDANPANFFSFFTIESNLLASAVFLYSLVRRPPAEPLGAGPSGWDLLRGAAAAYMTTTFIVYGLLLSGIQRELQLTEPWVNSVLHQIMPVVVFLDWFLDPPKASVSFGRASIWMIFPLSYLAYSLIRGPIVDWYPYPFLDPAESGGYPGVAAYAVAIAIGFLGIIWVFTTLGQRVRLRINMRN